MGAPVCIAGRRAQGPKAVDIDQPMAGPLLGAGRGMSVAGSGQQHDRDGDRADDLRRARPEEDPRQRGTGRRADEDEFTVAPRDRAGCFAEGQPVADRQMVLDSLDPGGLPELRREFGTHALRPGVDDQIVGGRLDGAELPPERPYDE